MKTLKFYLLALVAGTMLIINGCEDDSNPVDPGPSTASGNITLDGGGYDNETFNITSGGALYDEDEDETGIALYGVVNNDTAKVFITFPGDGTGTFQWSGDTTSYVSFYTNVSTIFLSVAGGSTTITSYGSVGGYIEGIFSGTVSLFSGTESIEISGSFKVRRGTNTLIF